MHLDTRTQLLFDDYFLERAEGVRLCMNAPVQHPEPVLVPDKPWEALGIAGYNTVLREDGRFRLWYGAMMKQGLPQEGAIRLCYAESADGLHWEKPELNLLPFQGSTANNIVAPPLERQSQQGATVYRDERALAEERYKLWTKFRPTDDEIAAGRLSGLYAMTSPDGLRWTIAPDQPNPPEQMCDTQNMFFWDDRIAQYVGYTRVSETQMFGEAAEGGIARYRSIGRITSPDFRAWSETQIVLQADETDLAIPLPEPKVGARPAVDVYTSCAMKLPHAQDAYLMLPSFYYHWGAEDEPATLDVQFLTSRDGIAWRRAGGRQPFLRHGLDGSASSGMLFANPWPIPVGNETWLYYMGTSRRHRASSEPARCGLFRASLRRDGFVSADADYSGGEFTTPPFTFDGDRLQVNADGSAAGWLKVEVQDPAGNPLPGFTAADARPVLGNRLDHPVTWKEHGNLSGLAGRPIRLRFVMRDIKLYAFRLYHEG
ncbi:MAG: glycoside hydrolase family protein [Armatimonadota bacterium]